jgi:hypothetical protein
LEGLKIFFTARAMGVKIGWWSGVTVITVGIFFAAITPFQLTGFPVQVYILTRSGLNFGTASLVILGRGISSAFAILIFVLPATKFSNLPPSIFYRAFYIYVAIVASILFLIIAFCFFNPRFLLALTPKRYTRLRCFIERETIKLREAGRSLTRKSSIPHLTLTLLSSILALAVQLTFLPSLLLSFGVNFNLLRAMSLALLVQVGLLWSPSPGAMGIAEAISGGVFLSILPKEYVGLVVVLWRFFTLYLTATLGGMIFLKLTLNWRRAISET